MPKRIGNGKGIGGPAKGPGIGGPAKGEGKHAPTKIREGVPTPVVEDNRDPDEQAYRQDRKRWKRETREAMLKVLVDNANDIANRGLVQITAANSVLDRIDGKPVQKNQITGDDDGPVKIETIRRVIVRPGNTDTGDI